MPPKVPESIPAIPKSIDGYTVPHLLKTARDVVKRKTENSVVLDEEAESRIPKFHEKELTIGRVLGRGGFCVVNEINKISLNDNLLEQHQLDAVESIAASSLSQLNLSTSSLNHLPGQQQHLADEDHIHNVVQDRAFMEKFCIRKGRDTRYAIKRLQETSFKDAQTFVNGIVDLAIEARFLAVIRHPNIVKMRAVRVGSPFSDGAFFVVLDRLYDILTQRLVKWNKQQFTGMRKVLDRGGKKEMVFWIERITVAYDLACALKYLHDLNVVYRDIKPDNIGFDVRGDVKIFDFGLAKEFDPKTAIDGAYKLTGDTGSPRYMAVEVALNQPYNETCDVYSFCILLWQILKLETPFEGFTMNMFDKKVVRGGARPKVEDKWPIEIKNLLRTGWGDWKSRPSMDDVCTILREEINRNSDEEIVDTMDASRKSEMSLRRGGA